MGKRVQAAFCVSVLALLLASIIPITAWAQGEDVSNSLAGIAKLIVDILIGIAAVILAVGIAYKAAKGGFEIAMGSPRGLSQTSTGIVGMVICFLVAALTISIANLIIDQIMAQAPAAPGGELAGVVGEGLRWAAAFCAFWLTIGIAEGATEAELGYALDNPMLIWPLVPKIIGLTTILAIAVFAPQIASLLGSILGV